MNIQFLTKTIIIFPNLILCKIRSGNTYYIKYGINSIIINIQLLIDLLIFLLKGKCSAEMSGG